MTMIKMKWGAIPHFYGPFHYYKETLIVDRVKRYLGKDRARVLDAGCGSGSLAVKLAKLGFDVWAVDISQEFVNFVEEKAKRLKLARKITVSRGDILSLPYSEGFFDGVCCGDVLEHLENDQKAVFEFFRVLKPGGVCFVTVPAHRSLWSKIDEWAGHQRRYEKAELEELFRKAEFTIKEGIFFGAWVSRFWWQYIYSRLVLGKSQRLVNRQAVFEIIPKFLFQDERVLKMLSLPFRIDNIFLSEKGIGLILVGAK